ncbi:MAG: cytochrome c oxidase subunit 3 family protein [Planctomycetota bacterium]|nr:cytochrome c oxidase subunit 3 family protein [Planctomycetota bacterium]
MSGDAHQEQSNQQAEHGDGHGHSPYQAHHFDTMQQQFEAGKLGMWLFLATEVLLFGGLFCFYTVTKSNNPELFKWGHHFLDKRWGATNTMVLLFSSLTMALAVREAQLGRKNRILFYLTVTLLCGGGFMGIKYIEYSKKFHEGLFPGQHFAYENVIDAEQVRDQQQEADRLALADLAIPAATVVSDTPKASGQVAQPASPPAGLSPAAGDLEHGGGNSAEHSTSGDDHAPGLAIDPSHLPPGARPANAHVFFSIYFCLTGLHGIHVLIGMGVMIWLMVLAQQGRFGPGYFTPVDLGGLYWHLVDLIWIYLFPLLYLVE